jgi:hypothetical protein
MFKAFAQQLAVNPVAASVFNVYNACPSSAAQSTFLSHVCVPAVQQFEVQEAANDDVLEVDFREMRSVKDKKHWMHKFGKHYVEGVADTHADMFNTSQTKYVAAVANSKDIGFVYLINLQAQCNSHSANAWRLDCGYVKGQYRSRRVFQQLISHVVKKYNVVEISIEKERYLRNEQYYADLGFPHFVLTEGPSLGVLLHDSYVEWLEMSVPVAA